MSEENEGVEIPLSILDQFGPAQNGRCGFVALIGAPNAGKSTLINKAVGSKVSIVSPKVQTTRTRVMGITIQDKSQIIFVDTPGIFVPKRRLDRAMVTAAWDGASDADVVILMYDAARKRIDDDTKRIIETLKERKQKIILVLNKIDLIPRDKLLPLAAEFDSHGIFERIFMLSAETGNGVEDLLTFITERVPQGPWMFPEDQISDMPMRLLAAEITREKLFLQLHEELPYATTVETESWEEFEDGSVKVSQIIYVRRESQRKIALGYKGSKIKAIGTAARKELCEMFEQKVHLKLFVKVRDKWGDDPERFHVWGLNPNV